MENIDILKLAKLTKKTKIKIKKMNKKFRRLVTKKFNNRLHKLHKSVDIFSQGFCTYESTEAISNSVWNLFMWVCNDCESYQNHKFRIASIFKIWFWF